MIREQFNKVISLGSFVANGSGNAVEGWEGNKSAMASGQAAGAFSFTATFYGHMADQNTNGVPLGSCTVSSAIAGSASDGIAILTNWPFIYVVISGMTGSPTINTFLGG